MEWLLMTSVFAKLPFCGLVLQGRDCPRLSHFLSCKLPERDEHLLTSKALQDGGKVICMFLVPMDRPAPDFKHTVVSWQLWFCSFCTLIYFACTMSCSTWLICIFVQAASSIIQLIFGQANLRPGELQEWITLIVLSRKPVWLWFSDWPRASPWEDVEGGETRNSAFPQKDEHHKHCI